MSASSDRFVFWRFFASCRLSRLGVSMPMKKVLTPASDARRKSSSSRATSMESCVEKLPPHQQKLIRECYRPEVSIKDAAASLGRTATSLYKALDRIRELLFDCIEKRLAQEGAP